MLALVFATLVLAEQGKPDVPALVKQLGADSYNERETASAALAQIGAPALAEIRKALRSNDAEVRLRAKRLANAIEGEVFRELHAFGGHSGSVNGVAWSPDGKRFVSADHRAVRVWDLSTRKQLARTEEHDDRVMAVAFSPDGKLIASASEDRTVRLWDSTTLSERAVLRGHKWDVRSIAFSRDGKRLFSGGRDETVRVWDVASGKSLKVIRATGPVFAAALCPEGRYVLLGTPKSSALARVDLLNESAAVSLPGHDGCVMSVCLTRDGKRAVTGSQDRTLRVWDLTTLKTLHILNGHDASISCVAVSADGQRAVSGGNDKKLYIWDLTTGTLVRELTGHAGPIWSVALSADGKRALSASHDGSVRLWAVGY